MNALRGNSTIGVEWVGSKHGRDISTQTSMRKKHHPAEKTKLVIKFARLLEKATY